jgi:hypothetical protein
MSQSRAIAPSPSREAKSAALARAAVAQPVSRSFRRAAPAGAGPSLDFSHIPILAARPALQRKLTVGAAGDSCEREADAIAAQVIRAPAAMPVAARGFGLQRKCAACAREEETEKVQRRIGGSAGALQRKCEACAREDESETMQRRASSSGSLAGGLAPPIVHQVLRTPGAPLGDATRAFFEPRFGHDFSRVRVHADAQAARSADSVGAQAYTVGNHIVFNAGRYAPATTSGGELLAHELTHTVQQGAASTVRRSVGGFFANIGRAFVSIFTDEPGYSDDDLKEYLGVLDKTGDIEDDYDSDNKARAVVNKWKKGQSQFSLTEQRKALLIREMLSGSVGDDDEDAILEVLERSFNFELTYIFGSGGVTVAKLDSKLDGDQHKLLIDFFERRFKNGFDGALKGDLTLAQAGLPTDVGAPLGGNLLAESHTEWNVACLLGILCSEDKTVIAELPKLTVQTADEVVEVYWEYDNAAWQKKERRRGAFSKSDEKLIGLTSGMSCATAAQAIVHEVRHQKQPQDLTSVEAETDAYTFAEDWAIKRGLPGFSPAFRTTAPGAQPGTKQIVPDTATIEAYAKKRYSGTAAAPGDRITGHRADGETELDHADGSPDHRPPQTGDSHQDVAATKAKLSGLPKVDPKLWACRQTGPQQAPAKAQKKSP